MTTKAANDALEPIILIEAVVFKSFNSIFFWNISVDSKGTTGPTQYPNELTGFFLLGLRNKLINLLNIRNSLTGL